MHERTDAFDLDRDLRKVEREGSARTDTEEAQTKET